MATALKTTKLRETIFTDLVKLANSQNEDITPNRRYIAITLALVY
jgi:hypothetical protein